MRRNEVLVLAQQIREGATSVDYLAQRGAIVGLSHRGRFSARRNALPPVAHAYDQGATVMRFEAEGGAERRAVGVGALAAQKIEARGRSRRAGGNGPEKNRVRPSLPESNLRDDNRAFWHVLGLGGNDPEVETHRGAIAILSVRT